MEESPGTTLDTSNSQGRQVGEVAACAKLNEIRHPGSASVSPVRGLHGSSDEAVGEVLHLLEGKIRVKSSEVALAEAQAELAALQQEYSSLKRKKKNK